MRKYLFILVILPALAFIGCTCDYTTGRVSVGCYDSITACAGDIDIISPSGTIELQTPVWATITIPMNSVKPDASSYPGFAQFMDAGWASQGVYVYWFDPDKYLHVYFAAEVPHDYVEGTDLHFHVHWTPRGNGAANQVVVWEFEYTWANEAEIFSNTDVISESAHIPAETLVASKHYVTDFTVSNPISPNAIQDEISSILVCRLSRAGLDQSDDYGDYAGLLACDFHYQKNTMGSRDEWDK